MRNRLLSIFALVSFHCYSWMCECRCIKSMWLCKLQTKVLIFKYDRWSGCACGCNVSRNAWALQFYCLIGAYTAIWCKQWQSEEPGDRKKDQINITERPTEAISPQNLASNLGNAELDPVTGGLAERNEKTAIYWLDQGGNSCLQGLTLLVTSMLRLARISHWF